MKMASPLVVGGRLRDGPPPKEGTSINLVVSFFIMLDKTIIKYKNT